MVAEFTVAQVAGAFAGGVAHTVSTVASTAGPPLLEAGGSAVSWTMASSWAIPAGVLALPIFALVQAINPYHGFGSTALNVAMAVAIGAAIVNAFPAVLMLPQAPMPAPAI